MLAAAGREQPPPMADDAAMPFRASGADIIIALAMAVLGH